MTDHKRIEQSIATLEAQRAILGDSVVDLAVAALRKQLAELELGGAERKPVTILFADLADFTTLSEQLDPELARRVMNTCFDVLKQAIDRYHGHVDKYMGDEVMVLFGAPLAYEDHAERALRAALAMREALEAFRARLDEDPQLAQLPPAFRQLEIHIGVNTGLVIAGGIGARDEQQYSVIGDAVNVASRLTDLSAAGQILVGHATFQLVSPLFDFKALLPAVLKGKQERHQVYELLGIKPQPGRVRGLESLGLRSPLVGRTEELARIQAIIEQLRAGRGGAIAIVGEAGVGKSRLVAELRRQNGLPWYEGRCLSYGEMISYHPFLGLLRSLIGVVPAAEPAAEPAALETSLRTFLADLIPARTAELYPYLADFLALSLPPAERGRIEALSGESRQWQIFQIFKAILSHLAQRSPLVLVMEDLHWMDPTSAALLQELLPLAARLPVLFLLVQRPYGCVACDRLRELLRAELPCPYQELELSPLSLTHSRELIWHLLAVEALPEAVRELILSRAEGNPLYLEEILRALIGQGVLQRRNSHWGLAPGVGLAQIELPTTLQGVILARLDRLEVETKQVLQMAAVIGRIFWYRVLDYVLCVEWRLVQASFSPDLASDRARELGGHLARLEQVELIHETRKYPDVEYIFKHVLIQDAAYQSLLKEQRQRFHQQVAQALESVFVDNLEEQYSTLARHYQAAGSLDRARHYLNLAGDRARRAYALLEAEDAYRRALGLTPPEDDYARQQVLFKLGLVAMTRGEFSQASEHYSKAFQLRLPQVSRPSYVQRPLRLASTALRTLEPGIPCDVASGRVIQQLFCGLVEFDTDLNIVPELAERWTVDAEGRSYRFHLRHDALWSDGTPLTAYDVEYAWRYWSRPDSGTEWAPWLHVLRGAEDYRRGRTSDPAAIGVRAVDDFTLEVELESPLAYFLSLLAAPIFYPLPRHRWPPARPPYEDPGGFVSNGPFRLVSWRPDDRLVIERNPFYGGPSRGNVAKIEVIFGGASDRSALYQADEVDVLRGVGVQATIALEQAVPAECWRQGPGLQTSYCGLVPSRSPLDDRRVRHALALSVDRSRLAEVTPQRVSVVARGGFVPPGIPGHSPELALPYDPERARDLLREAGYADGAAISPLRYFAQPGQQIVPQVLIAGWQAVLGIEFILEQRTMAEIIDLMGSDPPHLFSMTWLGDYPDPHNFLAQGWAHSDLWQDEAYWAKIKQAACTLDVRQRMDLYHELDRQLVAEEALCIPLSYGLTNAVVQPRVRHLPLWPIAYESYRDVLLDE